MTLIPSVFQKENSFVSTDNVFVGNVFNPSAAVDVVGVYDRRMNQLFPLARPAKANINESARIAEHPVESGGTISDNRVIQPVEIELILYVTDYENTYKRIKAAFLANELLTVQTRTGIYQNMAIEAMPHEESPVKIGVLDMMLRLKEIKLVKAQFQALPPRQVKYPKDTSTVDRGEQKQKSVWAKGSDARTEEKAKRAFKK
jgi:hypothetical protein